MAYLVHNLKPIKVWLKKEFQYDRQDHQGEFERAILITAKSIPGRALEFEVLTEAGVLRDKLPIEAIVSRKDAVKAKTPDLQLWNCFSYNFTVIQKQWLNRCSVFCKDKKKRKGTYLWTFDWSGEADNFNYSLAEEPDEHKCLHFIQMDNGTFMLQPNNRVQWFEPSFVTKPFPEKPDYKVTTHVEDCELGDTWRTSDDDRQFYDVEES